MDKKKVLFVVHQLNYGGVQKSLIEALNAIDYDRTEVTLYVRKNRLDLLPEVNKNVTQILVNDDAAHYYRKPYAIWLQLKFKLCSIVNKTAAETTKKTLSRWISEQKILYEKKHFFSDGKKYDTAVAYIQGYPAKLVADCVQADRKVMFFHGSTDEEHEVHEAVFDQYDSIVGVSKGVREALIGFYPAWKDKITYLENCIHAEDIREKSLEQEIEVPEGKTILCTCGRFTPVKGFDLAVEAAKRLKEAGIPFVWYFVGDGPERSKIEALIRQYGLEEEIVIIGLQANPYPWYRACDIYVQPSLEESYGLSIAEAQVINKPVVTTATVGGKTLVNDGITGLICDISANALAESLKKLIERKQLAAEMEINLRKIDYAAMLEEYKKNWAELLEG